MSKFVILSITTVLRLSQNNIILCDGQASKETCTFIDYLENHVNSNTEIECSQNKVCNKTFKVSYIQTPPYFFLNSFNYRGIDAVLKKCCGSCVRYHEHILQNMTELTASAIKTSDFVYPILASSATQRLYGFYYLPYINVPSVMYITKTRNDLFLSLLMVYPIVIITLFLSLLSGFIAWILETWSNKEEFPRPFLIGWFEGFWWSFISITTVGYGDKVPKSIPARLFSIIWILVGMIAFSLLTGQLTGLIIKANDPPPASMNGKKIGTLRFRDYDAYVVSHNGGSVTRNEGVTDFYSDVLELIHKLNIGLIDGFVLDKWTLSYVTLYAKEWIPIDQRDFFINRTTRIEKFYDGEKLSYGMLVRRTDDYEYFQDFVRDSQLRIKIRDSEGWIKIRDRFGRFYSSGSAFVFSPSGSYFKHTIFAISGMLAFILFFGIFYEHKRKLRVSEGR